MTGFGPTNSAPTGSIRRRATSLITLGFFPVMGQPGMTAFGGTVTSGPPPVYDIIQKMPIAYGTVRQIPDYRAQAVSINLGHRAAFAPTWLRTSDEAVAGLWGYVSLATPSDTQLAVSGVYGYAVLCSPTDLELGVAGLVGYIVLEDTVSASSPYARIRNTLAAGSDVAKQAPRRRLIGSVAGRRVRTQILIG